MNRLQFSFGWLIKAWMNFETCRMVDSEKYNTRKRTKWRKREKWKNYPFIQRDTYSSLSLLNRGPIFFGLSFSHSIIVQHSENKQRCLKFIDNYEGGGGDEDGSNSEFCLDQLKRIKAMLFFFFFFFLFLLIGAHFECDETMFW